MCVRVRERENKVFAKISAKQIVIKYTQPASTQGISISNSEVQTRLQHAKGRE